VDNAFLDRFVYEGKCQRKEFQGFFLVFIFNVFSQFFYLRAKDGLTFLVDGIPAEASPPLPYSGLVMSHFFLLFRESYDKISLL
jgi:hypothetical protein